MRDICLDHLSIAEVDACALVRIAAEAGFAAASLFATPVPISRTRNFVTDRPARAELLAALRDTGLAIGIVEPFMLEPEMDWPLLEGLAGLTAEIGGTVNILGMDPEENRMRDSLLRLVDICRAAGAPAVIEGYPLSSIRNPTEAHELAQALAPDVGLCVDTLHVIRSGGSWADVAALPAASIRHVQLNDGPRQPSADRLAESVFARMLPGDGDFGVEALLPHLPEHATIAVEAPCRSLSALDPAARAAALFHAMAKLLAGM